MDYPNRRSLEAVGRRRMAFNTEDDFHYDIGRRRLRRRSRRKRRGLSYLNSQLNFAEESYTYGPPEDWNHDLEVSFTTSAPKKAVVLDFERPEVREKYEREGIEGLAREESGRGQKRTKVKKRT